MLNGGVASRVLGVGVLGAAGMLVGCSGDQQEMEALRSENIELRELNGELELALSEANDAFDTAAGERDALRVSNAELRAENATLSNRPAPVAAGGSTGFEGTRADVFTRPGELVVEVAGDVLFASGKAGLRDESKRDLDRIARVIQERYPSSEIRIAGHTDTDPIRKSGWESNEHLGAMRALAVEKYLASKGVSADRMYVASYGPAKSRSSKQESRRVEIVILAPDA